MRLRKVDEGPPLRRQFLAAMGLLLLSLPAACLGRAQPAAPPISVFAAASLGDAFGALGSAFQAQSGVRVELILAGSQQLANQIREGAPADVFAAANSRQMDLAVQSGRVAPGSQRIFAANRLAVIVPLGEGGLVANLQDLTKDGTRLVLAAKEVPAGQYALDFLAKAARDPAFGSGFADDVLRNVVSYEDNIKAVFNKVALGEADAGIVYVSDLSGQAAGRVRLIPIPEQLNVLARYPIAVIADSPRAEAAQAFVDFVVSGEGQAVLADYGFLPAQ